MCINDPFPSVFVVVQDLAEKKAIDGETTIRIAQETIQTLHSDLNRKDS